MPALAERIRKGDVRAASRLIRDVDDGRASAIAELQALFPHTGQATVIGLTGSPGSGKSSLTDRLIGHYRALGKKVGVVAVDPTSPFSGGAILGDRIRMQGHAADDEVFIRSLATRGHLGGLSRSAADSVRIMDALGKDIVIVETVGVGQDEIDIAGLAHCVIVVVVPGMGDDIQAIKAGILEVADVFDVNKADREGADRTVRDLRAMLELRHAVHGQAKADHWDPPIVKTVATTAQGLDELTQAIGEQLAFLDRTGQRAIREAARARTEFLAILRERLLGTALRRLAQEQGRLDDVAVRIAKHEVDPWSIADELARGARVMTLPRVLLTNDDGIESQGLRALEEALRPLCELWVVAPDREQSAASHAISLSRPLRIHPSGERRFAVDGTPTDCVYLAVNHLMKATPPDAVFSGINHGPNLAEDVLYSGTVAGAMEGTLLGIPYCVAMSAVPEGRRFSFEAAAALGRALLEGLASAPKSAALLFNVNVPADGKPGELRMTKLGRRGYFASVEERRDPRGRPYYWIGGPEREHENIPGSDCNAVFDERVPSITPLSVNLTQIDVLDSLASWNVPGFRRA